MQPILEKSGCFFIDRREVKCLNYSDIRKLAQEHAVVENARDVDGLWTQQSILYHRYSFRPASDPCTASRRNSLCTPGTME